MLEGFLAGLTWGLETVVLGYALAQAPFVSSAQAVFLAPFVSTFLHDACSALWAGWYNGVRCNLKNVGKALRRRGGRMTALAAVIGGPVGMTGYVLTIRYMGASVGAVSSAIFPAIGAVLARIFLKEQMKWYQWLFLGLTMVGVFGLSYSPELNITNFWMGLMGTLLCSFGWGVEAVILAASMQDPEVKDEYALQIRQTTSALVYGIVLLPLLKGWGFTVDLVKHPGDVLWLIALAALFATASYLFYYRAISRIGASKAMALNITYAAWAIVFNALLFHETSSLNGLTIICTVGVILCGTGAAVDFRTILPQRRGK